MRPPTEPTRVSPRSDPSHRQISSKEPTAMTSARARDNDRRRHDAVAASRRPTGSGTKETTVGLWAASGMLRLQRAAGNRAVGQMLVQQQGRQPIPTSATPVVVQRLRKGDFKELASHGLDVGTWIEFADVVNRLSYTALTLASRLLEHRTGVDVDVIRAKLLIDRRRYQLHPPPRSRILDAAFGESSPHPKKAQVERYTKDGKPQIVVGDNVAESTVIASASDLLVWLVSHPTGSERAPKSFAEVEVMVQVLDRLWSRAGLIEPPDVWEALHSVLQQRSRAAAASEEEEESSSEGASGLEWAKGDWASVEDKDTKNVFFDEPARFRRKMPSEELTALKRKLKQELDGYELVGVHATQIESMATLVAEGVSAKRFGSQRGQGKGKGFYLVPVTGRRVNKSLLDTVVSWGTHVVAVYLPTHYEKVEAEEGQTVQALEQEHKGKRCYFLFGNHEAVVPPSLCPDVKLVTDPADIAVAPAHHPAEADTSGPRGLLDFLNELPS